MILADKNRIERTIKRMAYQIAEEAHGSRIHLAGLNERGFALAKQLQANLQNSVQSDVNLTQIDAIGEELPHKEFFNVRECMLVIVDDVIFSGSTIMKAIEKSGDLKRFSRILVSVLVDRGHRKYPLQAAVIGMNIPTKLDEQITVELTNGMPEKVVLSNS